LQARVQQIFFFLFFFQHPGKPDRRRTTSITKHQRGQQATLRSSSRIQHHTYRRFDHVSIPQRCLAFVSCLFSVCIFVLRSAAVVEAVEASDRGAI
jgi:hypothetical protein